MPSTWRGNWANSEIITTTIGSTARLTAPPRRNAPAAQPLLSPSLIVIPGASIAVACFRPHWEPEYEFATHTYIQFKPGLITADGEVTDEATQEFLRNYMTEMHAFIVRVLTVLPRNA